MDYNPFQIYGAVFGYNNNKRITQDIIVNADNFMNNTYYLWHSNPNITRLEFFFTRDHCKSMHDITNSYYHYVTAELFLFVIFALLLFHSSFDFNWGIRLLIVLSMMFWLSGIAMDIRASTNYDTMNNFVGKQLYDVQGTVWDSNNYTKYNWHFENQYELLQFVCDIWNRTPVSSGFIEFVKFNPIDSLGEYKIWSGVFKCLSLIFLIASNIWMGVILYREKSYVKIEDNNL